MTRAGLFPHSSLRFSLTTDVPPNRRASTVPLSAASDLGDNTRMYGFIRPWALFLAAVLAPLSAAAQQAEDYLPLTTGRTWTLRSPAVGTPIVLQLQPAGRGLLRLRFENPWITSLLTIRMDAGKVVLTALDMGGGVATMPENTVYWDFTRGKGQKWNNGIGEMTVVARDLTVRTKAGTFNNCIRIQEKNKKGDRMYWTFAPGVGFVQFGEGGGAFLLEQVSTSSSQPESQTAPTARRRAPRQEPAVAGASRVMVALAANPFAGESFSPRSVRARFEDAVHGGISYIYISPKWNEVETGRERYKWNDIDYQTAQAAEQDIPIVLHIRPIDTNQRAFPQDLMRKPLDDAELRRRYLKTAEEALRRCRGRARYVLIGNEVDSYFGAHRNEIGPYGAFLDGVISRLREVDPQLQFSLSIGFNGLDMAEGALRPLYDRCDFFGITYYPLTPDFKARPASVVPGDFQRIIRVAQGRKVLLQEVGFPSSPTNGSSEKLQADMFGAILDAVRREGPNRFIGINFCFMSDFSDDLVRSFSAYYNMPGADRFKSFLGTLGMFDKQGRPKAAWGLWTTKVRALTGRR